MNRTPLITVCALAILSTPVSSLHGATPPQTAPAGVTAERNRQWQEFNAEAGQRWTAEWNRDTGLLRRISGHRLELVGAPGTRPNVMPVAREMAGECCADAVAGTNDPDPPGHR